MSETGADASMRPGAGVLEGTRTQARIDNAVSLAEQISGQNNTVVKGLVPTVTQEVALTSTGDQTTVTPIKSPTETAISTPNQAAAEAAAAEAAKAVTTVTTPEAGTVSAEPIVVATPAEAPTVSPEVVGIKKEDVEKISKQLDKELDDKKNNAKDENEKAILDALIERYKDKGKIEEDFEGIKTNSPEPLIKELLRDRIVYGKRIFPDAEIDSLLADKSEGSFYKKTEQEVVMQVLRRGILEKGLTKEDVLAIENAPWSKNAVEKAFGMNSEAQKAVAKLIKDEGETGIHSIKDLWEKAKKRPWLLILVLGLAGGLPGVAVGALVLATQKKV